MKNMRKQVDAEYWVCIIGGTNSNNLKSAADYPMRNAVKNAFIETTGHECENCWSGWGSEKEMVRILSAVWQMSNDDPLYEAIKCMFNGRSRIASDEV